MPFNKRFQHKLWDSVNLCNTGAVYWNKAGDGIIFNFEQFKKEYLDRDDYFCKSNKIASFVRQLNLYGFKKVTYPSKRSRKKDFHEFTNPWFARERGDLLRHMSRNSTYPTAKNKSVTKKRRRGRYKKHRFEREDTVLHKRNKRGRPRKKEHVNRNFQCEKNDDNRYEKKKDANTWHSLVEGSTTKLSPSRKLLSRSPEYLALAEKSETPHSIQKTHTKCENGSFFKTHLQIIENRLKVYEENDTEIHTQKEGDVSKLSENDLSRPPNTKLKICNAKHNTSTQVVQHNSAQMQQKVTNVNSFSTKDNCSKISNRKELTRLKSGIHTEQYQGGKLDSVAINDDSSKKTMMQPKFHQSWTMQATVQGGNCVALKIRDLASNNHADTHVTKVSYQTKTIDMKPNFKENGISKKASVSFISRAETPKMLTENALSIELAQDTINNFESMVEEPVGYKALLYSYKTDCEISDEYLALRETYLRQTHAKSFVGNCVCLKSHRSYDL